MKKVLAIMLVLAMLLGLGCTAYAEGITQDELLGIWEMDISSIFSMMVEQGAMTADDMEVMKPFLSLMSYHMQFSADGKYTMLMSAMGEEDKTEGEYAVVDGVLMMDGSPVETTLENGVLTISEEEMSMTMTKTDLEALPATGEMDMNQLLGALGSMEPAEPTEPTEPTENAPAPMGKLEIVQENAAIVDRYGLNQYVFAKVQNVGDAEIMLDDCNLAVYDADEQLIAAKDYGQGTYIPLKPGEYAYVTMYKDIEEGKEADHYTFGVTAGEYLYDTTVQFPAEATMELGVGEGWNQKNWMYVTITNNTDETVYNMELMVALLDAEGNILYTEYDSLYNTGILPGGSVVVRLEIPSEFMQYFEANSLTPAAVDAIAYVQVDTF